jgi:DeoR/GlpR family transcriptional regulator of sugar metabolism
LDELALVFHVTTRTIRRDLELLEEVGFRVPRWRDEYQKRVA